MSDACCCWWRFFLLGMEMVDWWVAVAQLAEEHVCSHELIRMVVIMPIAINIRLRS